MKQILLDTNAYSRLLAGDEAVLSALADCETVYLSVFVLGELFAGFRGGAKEKENRELLDACLKKEPVRVLDACVETSEIFGELKDSLKRAGAPIPINDVWIAAHAIETGSVLITFDTHFHSIPGLRVRSNLSSA